MGVRGLNVGLLTLSSIFPSGIWALGSYPIQIGLHEKQNKTKIEIKKKNKTNDKNVNSKGGETCNIIAQAAVNIYQFIAW